MSGSVVPSRVLAIDSAFGPLSVAVAESANVLAASIGAPGAKAAEDLAPLVQSVLLQAHLTMRDIDRIAVTLGPGGFTSLRAGLALAKGLAVGAGKEIIGFTTLEAIAITATSLGVSENCIAIAIDAKRDEVFLQIFDAHAVALTPPMVVPVTSLAIAHDWLSPQCTFALGGTAAKVLAEMLTIKNVIHRDLGLDRPDAATLAVFARNVPVASRPADAVYLRPADARPSS